MSQQIIGILAALTSAASWALGSILFKKVGEKVSAFGMTLTKGIFGIVMFGLIYAVNGFRPVPANVAILLLISGIVGIAIGDTLFFISLQNLGPRIQIIFFMMGQVVTAFLGILLLHEIPKPMQWIGIFITLGGVAVVIWKKIFGAENHRRTGVRGILLGLLSMLCFSTSLIIAKGAIMSISTLDASFIRISSGTLGMLIYGLGSRKIVDWLNPFQDMHTLVYFFLSVCLIMFGGFWLSLVAIKFLKIAVASTLSATEPLFILPLTFIFLKERITAAEIIGALLTMGGVVIIIHGSLG